MSSITLNVVDGLLKGQHFSFSEPNQILVGRANACDLRLPNDPLHWDASRLHCVIVVNGPHATIRDLGSRNGTFVNCVKIGQRVSFLGADEADTISPPHRLDDGDQIQVGHTVFEVEMHQDAQEVEALEREPALV
jgi:serine/threonine-protein kinase